MRVPEQWLKGMVDPQLDIEALADRLTMAGLEVEDSEPLAPAFSGVVVARVLSTDKHPDADRLKVCKVDIGRGGEPLQIVCGAPNVVPNMIAACATEGAELPGGFKIKRAKMRGVESQGMLCSAKELGIAEDAQGLMVLPTELASQLGADVRKALGLDTQVMTLKLTPNRADCLSILGVAREVAALTGATLNAPQWPIVNNTISDQVRVRIQDADLCGRFSGRVIRNVNAKAPTPEWMRSRLEQAGQRSISALVDISNYVMLELGRPNHIFDLDKVKGDLVVRWAKAGESLELLNGQTIALDPTLGVIADDQGPEAFAGIMGGNRTSVSLETRHIYVEAAFWWPDAIRGRARRFNFTTDAGHRFERGVDWEPTVDHVHYITHLIQTICGGDAGPVNDEITTVPKRPVVTMRVARCAKILGVPVTAEICMDIFKRLGLSATISGDAQDAVIAVTPPSYRFDLEIEEDLIEEVARIYGFSAIPARPPLAPAVMHALPETCRSAMQLRDRMVANDYVEAITYSFISADEARAFSDAEPLALLNPMASHQSVMRTSLLPGLLQTLATNLNRKQTRVRVFEIGRIFLPDACVPAGDWSVKGIDQPVMLAGLAYGGVAEEQWGQAMRSVDFFDVKADLESLVAPLTIHTRVMSKPNPALHPGRSAEVLLGNNVIGVLGELHPALVQQHAFPMAPVVFELRMNALQLLEFTRVSDVSRFPPVTRDLAVVIPAATAAGTILDRLFSLKNQLKQGLLIQSIKCFDEYRGKGLSENEKSLAFRFILQSPETTLQDPEVDALVNDVLQVLKNEFSARLRS